MDILKDYQHLRMKITRRSDRYPPHHIAYMAAFCAENIELSKQQIDFYINELNKQRV